MIFRRGVTQVCDGQPGFVSLQPGWSPGPPPLPVLGEYFMARGVRTASLSRKASPDVQ